MSKTNIANLRSYAMWKRAFENFNIYKRYQEKVYARRIPDSYVKSLPKDWQGAILIEEHIEKLKGISL